MPLVIGHRGASADHPENTIAAFNGARDQGADGVELDVRRTHDGVLVVHHDPIVAGSVVIADAFAHELPPTVPTLAEALGACVGLLVNVEIKNDPGEPGFDGTDRLVNQTIEVIAASGGSDILVSSFHLPTIDQVRQRDVQLDTGFLVLDPTQPHDAVRVAADGGHRALHPWNVCTTEGIVDSAHEAGLVVNVWTVDDADRIRQLASWGVDGIITNRPSFARSALAD